MWVPYALHRTALGVVICEVCSTWRVHSARALPRFSSYTRGSTLGSQATACALSSKQQEIIHAHHHMH
eukprot:scaffold97770_cov48-Phaeocystis_antarctica.AAC.1